MAGDRRRRRLKLSAGQTVDLDQQQAGRVAAFLVSGEFQVIGDPLGSAEAAAPMA